MILRTPSNCSDSTTLRPAAGAEATLQERGGLLEERETGNRRSRTRLKPSPENPGRFTTEFQFAI